MKTPKETPATSAMRRRSEGADALPGPSVARRRSARLASKQSSREAIMEVPRLRSGVKARPPRPVVPESEPSATVTNTLSRKRKAATVEKARLCSGKTSSRGRTKQVPKGIARPFKRTLPTKAVAKESSVKRPKTLVHNNRNVPSSSGAKKRPVRMRAPSRFSSSSSPSSSSSSGTTRSAAARRSSRSASSGSYRSRKRRRLSASSSETSVPGSEAQRWLESSSGGIGSCSSAEKQRRLRSGWTSSNRSGCTSSNRSSETSAYRRRFLKSGSSSSSSVAKRAAKRQRRARGRPPSSRSAIGGSEEQLGTRGPRLPGRVQTGYEKVSRWLARMTEP